MPGWYGHNIRVNVDASIPTIDIEYPCEVLAQEVNADLSNIAGKLVRGKDALVTQVAEVSQSLQVSALDSYGSNKSGRLAGSITVESGGDSARIGTDLFYAEYVNDGRGSVTATNAKVLHFFNDGEEVFVKSVGPSTPRPYVDDSSSMLSSEIDSIINNFLGQIV